MFTIFVFPAPKLEQKKAFYLILRNGVEYQESGSNRIYFQLMRDYPGWVPCHVWLMNSYRKHQLQFQTAAIKPGIVEYTWKKS